MQMDEGSNGIFPFLASSFLHHMEEDASSLMLHAAHILSHHIALWLLGTNSTALYLKTSLL